MFSTKYKLRRKPIPAWFCQKAEFKKGNIHLTLAQNMSMFREQPGTTCQTTSSITVKATHPGNQAAF